MKITKEQRQHLVTSVAAVFILGLILGVLLGLGTDLALRFVLGLGLGLLLGLGATKANGLVVGTAVVLGWSSGFFPAFAVASGFATFGWNFLNFQGLALATVLSTSALILKRIFFDRGRQAAAPE